MMKRIGVTIALASNLLVAQVATAQMMGGGGNHHGSSPATGGNLSGAMMGRMGRGDMLNHGGHGMGQLLTVGPDSIAYALRASTTATTDVQSVEVVAIRPRGTIAWTTKIAGGVTRLDLSGNLVLVATSSGAMGMSRFRLTALDTATGSIRWQLDLDGLAAAIEPYPGGFYALIAQPNGKVGDNGMHGGSNGTMLMKRSVAAIDDTGQMLWNVDLN